MNENIFQIIHPTRVWSRAEVLSRPCPVPRASGVYAWYFLELPPFIITERCEKFNDLTLLYIGISPKSPPINGRPTSKETICSRIKFHYRRNAEGSTLRFSLGCLLSEKLGIHLSYVGNGRRKSFCEGEEKLNNWMNKNAFVTWVKVNQPWALEEKLITRLFLPLNLQMNEHNPNYEILSSIRKNAKSLASESPIATC